MSWRHRSEYDKPYGQRRLDHKLYIVCNDPKSNTNEIVRYLSGDTLFISPLLEKGITLDTRDEYDEYSRRCSREFPNLTFYVTSEKYLPDISRLPLIDNVESRPLR